MAGVAYAGATLLLLLVVGVGPGSIDAGLLASLAALGLVPLGAAVLAGLGRGLRDRSTLFSAGAA